MKPAPIIDAERAKAIKLALAQPEATPATVAAAESLPYMVVYKIAAGITWKGVTVRGTPPPVEGGRWTKKRVPTYNAALRDRVYALKRKVKVSNARLAAKLNLSETMVARCVRDGELLLAARVQRLLLTSGAHDVAMGQYALDQEEVERLAALAQCTPLPGHLAKELEEG